MSITLDTYMGYHGAAVKKAKEKELPLQAQEDAALVAATAKGDKRAYEQLVRRYRNDVFAMSYHFVRNREDAWDLSQEVFVKAYKSVKKFRGDCGFKSWLMRITANHAKDFLKKRRLKTVSYDEAIGDYDPATDGEPARDLAMSELGAQIQGAVDELPEKHKLAFVLREYEGLSYQEMAEVMDCSLGTVMSRLHYARKKLQNTLVERGVVEVADHAG